MIAMKTLLAARLLLTLTGAAACASLPFVLPGALADLSTATWTGIEAALGHAHDALTLEWVDELGSAARPVADPRR